MFGGCCGTLELESGEVFDDGWCNNLGCEVDVPYGFEEGGQLLGGGAEEWEDCESDEDEGFVKFGCEVDVPYGLDEGGQLSGGEAEEGEDCEGVEDEGFVVDEGRCCTGE